MGLDIYVNKVEKLNGRNTKDIEDYIVLSDHPELEIFKSYIFEKENEYYDLESAVKKKGYDLNELILISIEHGPKTSFIYETKEGKQIIIRDPKTMIKVDRCITYTEVGYQRKGSNSKFYEDGVWDSPYIVDLNTLKKHWVNYFSNNTPYSKGGWGSSVEYKLSNKEMKRAFKKNIIDNFKEGETFVAYN